MHLRRCKNLHLMIDITEGRKIIADLSPILREKGDMIESKVVYYKQGICIG